MAHLNKALSYAMESMAERAWKFGLDTQPQRYFSPYAGITWYLDDSLIIGEIIHLSQQYASFVR